MGGQCFLLFFAVGFIIYLLFLHFKYSKVFSLSAIIIVSVFGTIFRLWKSGGR